MRTCLLFALLLSTIVPATADEAAPTLVWQHEGHASLPAAAQQAKRTGKRLLVGLAGSPT